MSTRTGRRRAWIEVDLPNLVQNARTILAATPGARLLPMVKANAYGVGVFPVVDALESLDPWGFGVATVDEGVALRSHGVQRPIVVFTPARADWFESLRGADLRPVLDDPALVAEWSGPFHLEIDTGMGRAGVPWRERERVRTLIAQRPEGVFTHFHSADESAESVREQERRFRGVIDTVPDRPLVHTQNSAAAFRSEMPCDLVRPGIFLYGGCAGVGLPPPRPVVALRAQVVSLRRVQVGDTVSYGATWTAPSETTIATLGVGYADGVRRSVAGRASVMACGRRYRVVGRVTMDMTMVDVGAEPSVDVGDTVTVIGTDGGDTVTLDEFAGWADTISYEVLTGLGARLPRYY